MGYKRYGNSESVPTFNDDNNGEAVSNDILKNSSKKYILVLRNRKQIQMKKNLGEN